MDRNPTEAELYGTAVENLNVFDIHEAWSKLQEEIFEGELSDLEDTDKEQAAPSNMPNAPQTPSETSKIVSHMFSPTSTEAVH